MWKTNNLKQEILKYFLFFSIIFLSLLWILQFLLFPYFYKEQKTNDIKLVATKINKIKNKETFVEEMNTIALDKSVCIEIDDANFEALYTSNYFGKGCISNTKTTYQYKIDFATSNSKNKTYEIINPNYKNTTIVQAVKLEDNVYAFVNASIEPLDDTTTLLRKELTVITFMILGLSFVLANFISSHISKPIKEISKDILSFLGICG